MVSVILKKIYIFLFINISIIIFVSVILKKIIFIHIFKFICVVAKFSKGIIPIAITSKWLKLHRLSIIPV